MELKHGFLQRTVPSRPIVTEAVLHTLTQCDILLLDEIGLYQRLLNKFGSRCLSLSIALEKVLKRHLASRW